MRKTVLVIAPGVKQFMFRAQELPGLTKLNRSRARAETKDRVYQYVGSPQHMKGFCDVEVEFWGDLKSIKNIHDFEIEARMVKRK